MPKSIKVKERILNIKEEVCGWHFVKDVEIEQAIYTALAPDSFIFRQYQSEDGYPLMLVVVYHQNDRWGAHDPVVCYKSQGWEIIEEDHMVEITVGDRSLFINRLIIKKENITEMVYYYWFTSNKIVTSSRAKQMLYMVWNKLIYGFSESGFVRISMQISALMESEIIFHLNDFTNKFSQMLINSSNSNMIAANQS